MILHRRKFLMGLGALMAAPAIVSVSNIMPVKAMPSVDMLEQLLQQRIANAEQIMAESLSEMLYGDKYNVSGFGLSGLIEQDTIYIRGGIDRSEQASWPITKRYSGYTVTA